MKIRGFFCIKIFYCIFPLGDESPCRKGEPFVDYPVSDYRIFLITLSIKLFNVDYHESYNYFLVREIYRLLSSSTLFFYTYFQLNAAFVPLPPLCEVSVAATLNVDGTFFVENLVPRIFVCVDILSGTRRFGDTSENDFSADSEFEQFFYANEKLILRANRWFHAKHRSDLLCSQFHAAQLCSRGFLL